MHERLIGGHATRTDAGTMPLRWLHLSDIHMGCRGDPHWRRMVEAFQADVIDKARRRGGPPDLVLITGDIANFGKADEYGRFDRFLAGLADRLAREFDGSRPLVIPVPGNHDLARPQGEAARPYRMLRDMSGGDDDRDISFLREQLWATKNTAFFDALFENYLTWLGTSIMPSLAGTDGVSVHRSHFPGDISVRITLPGRPALPGSSFQRRSRTRRRPRTW